MKNKKLNNVELLIYALTKDPIIVGSWGACGIEKRKNGVRFNVNGMIHEGSVVIESVEKNYSVSLVNNEGKLVISLDDIPLEGIVATIDRLVETGDNKEEYMKKVRELYNLKY